MAVIRCNEKFFAFTFVTCTASATLQGPNKPFSPPLQPKRLSGFSFMIYHFKGKFIADLVVFEFFKSVHKHRCYGQKPEAKSKFRNFGRSEYLSPPPEHEPEARS